MKYLKQLKKVIHQAKSYGYLNRDPFSEYVTSYKETYRSYLSQEELDSIEKKDIEIERLKWSGTFSSSCVIPDYLMQTLPGQPLLISQQVLTVENG